MSGSGHMYSEKDGKKMKIRKYVLCAGIIGLVGMSAGCGQKTGSTEASQTVSEQTAAEESSKADSEAGAKEEKEASQDAGSETEKETAPTVQVVEDGMVPVKADALKDGVYPAEVDSSSSMFNITEAELTVAEGKMSVCMTLSGSGYGKVFMGTGEEAEKADEADYIQAEESADGKNVFEIPVEALDQGIDCAAYSKKKETWYDRTLVVRADSLPADAYKEGNTKTVESLGLKDGDYTVEVVLEGGSGRTTVESPTELKIEKGQATAVITWSSSHYDYMKIGDEKYDPVNTEGNSAFEIPVTVFDYKQKVIADTTAMSTPHEIEYTLTFDSESIKPQ